MPSKNSFKTFYALSIAWQLGFLIALPIAGFIFLGLLTDRFFKTHPLFVVAGALTGVIITVYETYHLIIPLIKDAKKKDDQH